MLRCDHSVCVMPLSALSATAPGLARVVLLEPGASLHVPASRAMDVLGVVLSGTVDVRGEGRDVAESASEWTAFLQRNGAVVLQALRDVGPALVVVVVAEDPAPEALSEPGESTLTLRDLRQTSPQSWASGAFVARTVFDATDSPRASLTLLSVGARTAMPTHVHAESTELLVPILADGMLHVASSSEPTMGAGNVVRAGQAQRVAAGQAHGWIAGGTLPFVAVQSYVPAGPERSYGRLAER